MKSIQLLNKYKPIDSLYVKSVIHGNVNLQDIAASYNDNSNVLNSFRNEVSLNSFANLHILKREYLGLKKKVGISIPSYSKYTIRSKSRKL